MIKLSKSGHVLIWLALATAACSDKDDDYGPLGPFDIDAGSNMDGGGPSLMDAALDASSIDASRADTAEPHR